MDNKKTVLGMAAVFLLCMGYWFFLVHYVYPKHPEWDFAGTVNQTTQTQNSGSGATTEPASASAAASTRPSIGAAPESTLLVAATQPAGAPTTLGSDRAGDSQFAVGLQIDPRGAGLNAVTLNSYKDADAKGLYSFQQPNADADDGPLATRSLFIDGQSVDLSAVNWRLEPGSTKTIARYGLDITGANHAPLLHISKTYQLQPRGPEKNRDNTAAGYEATVTYHLQNATTRPLNDVRLEFDGPTMPPREMERTDDRQIIAGYDKGNNGVDITRDYLAEFKPGSSEQKDLSQYKGNKLLWAGASSNYFGAIVLAENQGQLEKLQARCVNASAEADDREVVLDFQTAALSLPGGSSIDVPLKVFFGPKERDLLEGDFYGEFPRTYNQLLTSSSGICAICALPWLVDKLVDLLQVFHFFLRDWGLSIIALVVLVRAILHPISKHSQVSMLRLQKMGPELERLKKKYANDKEALAKAQMEMHKEMGITPFLGCLPMFLQMPIWIALYTALQNDIVLRQAPFLWGLTWIHDLARPDRLISWDQHPFTVPLIGMKVVSLNVLPLVVAVVMFLQQLFQPQPPTLTAEQASQQKMMRYMSLAFSLFFYWMPSGLNLYILTSSSIAIVESKRIREHIKQHEEREKANKVIVDVKPTRQGKQQQKHEPSVQAPKKRGMRGWWAELQQKAESIRREAEKKNRKGG